MNRPMKKARVEQMSATVHHINICDLPEELLVHISSYLSFYDRKLSRLVCKRWNEVSYSHCLIKNDWLVVPSVSSLKTLQHMPEYWKFVNLRISSVGNTYEETTFWLRFASKIKKVELIDASMTNPVIVDVLKSCTNLRSFALIGSEKRDFVAKSFVKSAPFMLPKLKCLKLLKVDDLLDEELNVLTENATNLTEIHLQRYVEDSEGSESDFSDDEYEFGGLFARELYSEDDYETGSENDYDSDSVVDNESHSNDESEEDDPTENEETDPLNNESCTNDVNEEGDEMTIKSCSNDDVNEDVDLPKNESCTNDVNEEDDLMKNTFCSNDVNEDVDLPKNKTCSNDVNEEGDLMKNKFRSNDVNDECNLMNNESCTNDEMKVEVVLKNNTCFVDEEDVMKNEILCFNVDTEEGDSVKRESYSDDENKDYDRMEYESTPNHELRLLKVTTIVDLVKRQSSKLTHLALSRTDFPGKETIVELISSLGKQLKYLKIKLPKDTPLQKKSIKALSENCPDLESIDLTFSTMKKDDFTTLFSSLSKVEKVRMLGVRTEIGNALQVLSNLEFLSEIDLSFCEIYHYDLRNLGDRLMPNLHVLKMDETWVQDDVILKISPMVPNITDWSLNFTFLGDIGLRAIVKNNKLLRFLSVIHCTKLTNVIPHINKLTELRVLDLSDCKGIPNSSFACLNLRFLQDLGLNGLAKPVYDNLKSIIEACPSLEHVYVDGFPDLKIIRPTIHCNGER